MLGRVRCKKKKEARPRLAVEEPGWSKQSPGSPGSPGIEDQIAEPQVESPGALSPISMTVRGVQALPWKDAICVILSSVTLLFLSTALVHPEVELCPDGRRAAWDAN